MTASVAIYSSARKYRRVSEESRDVPRVKRRRQPSSCNRCKIGKEGNRRFQ